MVDYSASESHQPNRMHEIIYLVLSVPAAVPYNYIKLCSAHCLNVEP